MTSWRQRGGGPNLSADPADSEPPHHDPPSKPDMAAVMLEVCRRALDEARARAADERARRRTLTPEVMPHGYQRQ